MQRLLHNHWTMIIHNRQSKTRLLPKLLLAYFHLSLDKRYYLWNCACDMLDIKNTLQKLSSCAAEVSSEPLFAFRV